MKIKELKDNPNGDYKKNDNIEIKQTGNKESMKIQLK